MTDALVTGATAGIGLAIARALRDAGHRVTGIGRDPAALARLEAEGIAGLRLDLADPDAPAALAGLAPEVLVNNAGTVPPLAHFCDQDWADIDRTLTLNLRAQLAVTRALVPGMRDRRRGHVFFTGSIAGHAPTVNLAVYGATKAALGSIAQSLRLELAPHRVRVTEIVAGRVESALYRDVLPERARAAMYADEAAVQPQDVAAMVLAVLAMPAYVDVSRFDILPTHQTIPSGADMKDA